MLYGLSWLLSRQARDCVKTLNNGCFYQHILALTHVFAAMLSDALPVYYYRKLLRPGMNTGSTVGRRKTGEAVR